ncbi:unnamed protein product [[Candida] boidinii]|uniref:Unnamed protein product n=1 Tax=Candida boidinii TaxID=5477 RepID=A0ACB5TMD7_CANBO|nr:unnamed protein product [[Candida] boidinii]
MNESFIVIWDTCTVVLSYIYSLGDSDVAIFDWQVFQRWRVLCSDCSSTDAPVDTTDTTDTTDTIEAIDTINTPRSTQLHSTPLNSTQLHSTPLNSTTSLLLQTADYRQWRAVEESPEASPHHLTSLNIS